MAQPASEPAEQSSAEVVAEALRESPAARARGDGLLSVPVLPLREAAPDARVELEELEPRRFAA